MDPHVLKKGDYIAIVAPAKIIDQKYIDNAIEVIEKNGFNAVVTPYCMGKNGYFAGTVKNRIKDFQWAAENYKIKAILCARGGYGSVQIMDQINWAGFLTHPQWVIGFSDITVFHQHLANLDVASIHGTMPLNFPTNSKEAIASLFTCLKKGKIDYKWRTEKQNTEGKIEGKVTGGNLTVLASLIGTQYMPDYRNKILFIEDVGEPLYAIDRCLFQLEKAGVFDKISGLILGSFTSIKETNPPYEESLETIVKSHFSYRTLPLCFDFPAGHIDDNHALIFGKTAQLTIKEYTAKLVYL